MSLPELTDATIWAIIHDELDDDTVQQLVWHHLGYRYDDATQTWDTSAVDEAWLSKYPTDPPPFLDSRPATLQLTRSIPQAYKQLLKEELGFKGYKIDELKPRLTRRATIANWLLGYRRGKA